MHTLFKIIYINARLLIAFIFTITAFTLSLTTAQATINCAGTLPSSYFERIENNTRLAGKLIEQAGWSQQLGELSAHGVMDNVSDAYMLMVSCVLAKQHRRYAVTNAAGRVTVPFDSDAIQTEPDIATSFIVSVKPSDA